MSAWRGAGEGRVARLALGLLLATAGCSGETVLDWPPNDPDLELLVPAELVWSHPASESEETLLERAFAFSVRDGETFVLDQLAGRVQRVSADGVYRGALGRPGEGPGELSSPAVLRIGPDGDVWVSSPAARRVSRFRPTGELVAEYRTPFPVVGFAVTPGGRLWIPTLEPVPLLAELDADGDTTMLPMRGEAPRRLRQEPMERLRFMGFLMAGLADESIVLLRNKHADDFDLWHLSIGAGPDRTATIDSVPLPAWLYEMSREAADALERELDPSFTTGDFMIPFKGIHSTGDGRLSLSPSSSDRVLAVSIDLEGRGPVRVVVPSEREEFRGLRDALLAGPHLFALYETEVRLYRLQPISIPSQK